MSDDGKVITANVVNADTALRNSDIFTVVNRISSDIASCDIRVSAPFKNVVDQPNNLISRYNFWQAVISQMCLTGNSYVIIERNPQGVPERLEQVTNSQVNITLEDYSKDITYTVNWNDERGQKDYKSQDVLHFRLFVSGQETSKLVGLSPLDSLIPELNIQDYSNKMSMAMLKNAIAPSYTLTIPQGILDDEAKENIRNSFEKANSGENAGKAIVLDQGLQLAPLQINPDIAKLISNTTFSQTQIAKAFGVSDSYLNGQGDQQSSVNMMRSLFVDSLNPYIKSIESEMYMKFGVPVKLDIESAVDIDNSGLINRIVQLTGSTKGSVPVLSAEQARAILKDKQVFPDEILDMKGGETNDTSDNGSASERITGTS